MVMRGRDSIKAEGLIKVNENTRAAYVLLNAEIGEESKALGNVRRIENVKEVYPFFGTYHSIARVEADDPDKLKETLTCGIRRADKVMSIEVMMVRNSDGKLIDFERDLKTGEIVYCHPSLK